jgi:hypothetical protein
MQNERRPPNKALPPTARAVGSATAEGQTLIWLE